MVPTNQSRLLLFIGTYTRSCDSNGIYVYEFDEETGDYDKVTSTENITSPSFISISDDKKFIYTVNENDD
ncbi:MAG: lactonase family protein, partial [Flavobacterium sp.]